MKQNYIGIDIIEIYRIKDAINTWGERFLRRIYTDAEIGLYQNSLESLAVRFSGKEAVIKALRISDQSLKWKDIEILNENNGRPTVNLYGQARKQFLDLGLKDLEISLSHSRENAIALVIGVRED